MVARKDRFLGGTLFSSEVLLSVKKSVQYLISSEVYFLQLNLCTVIPSP